MWTMAINTWLLQGFPWGSAGKESTCNAGDLGSIPGLGRSPGGGKAYPLQYSGLENSMKHTVHGVTKSRAGLSAFHSAGNKQVLSYLLTNSGFWGQVTSILQGDPSSLAPEIVGELTGLTKKVRHGEKQPATTGDQRLNNIRRESSNWGESKWDTSSSQDFTDGGTESLKLNGLPKITARERLQRTSKPRYSSPRDSLLKLCDAEFCLTRASQGQNVS